VPIPFSPLVYHYVDYYHPHHNPGCEYQLVTASLSSQIASIPTPPVISSQTITTLPSTTEDNNFNAGLVVGSVIGAIGVLGIVGLIALWILRGKSRQAIIACADPGQHFSSHHNQILCRAELLQYSYCTQGKSELLGDGHRGQNMGKLILRTSAEVKQTITTYNLHFECYLT
jgi:hypothetical protein